jgi:hypothetical protein
MVDVFAFAILMWAVFTRTKPYDKIARERRLNVWTLRDMILDGTRPDVDTSVDLDSMPTRAVLLMQQCWSGEVGQRPSGFDEIDRRLGEVTEAMRLGQRQGTRQPVTQANALNEHKGQESTI